MIRESNLDPQHAIVRETVRAGDYWLKEVKSGQTLRILDLEGNQAADTLFYNAADPSERYSAMDTIREQGNVYLTVGSELRSNLNNVMLEITATLAIPIFFKVLMTRTAMAPRLAIRTILNIKYLGGSSRVTGARRRSSRGADNQFQISSWIGVGL